MSFVSHPFAHPDIEYIIFDGGLIVNLLWNRHLACDG
jgi:hypothetical protein